MIKKSIVCILIVLLLINSIGCSSYQKVLFVIDADQELVLAPSEETFQKNEKVLITTWDGKTYTLTGVKVQGFEFRGIEWISNSKFREVVISAEEIKKIETQQSDTGLTLLPLAIIAGIFLGFIFYVLATSQK